MTTTFTPSSAAMPRRIRLINWHGHENATLDVNGGMLAIIGENGSGKSLILDAIDWALFPAPNKQFNAAAREGGRQSRRTLSNTILFFDPHGVDRPDRGWRRGRTVGFAALEVEHADGNRWVYGAAAAATPHSASPWYYALPGSLEQIQFLTTTPEGKIPVSYQEFKKANESRVNAGGEIFSSAQVEEYNRTVARRLLNIEGADWQRRYDALYDVLHRVLGLRVDDSLVADPSSVVRQFLPIVDRPHLERLVEGLEGIQRIHRDIDEYAKLHSTLGTVVEARRTYHNTVLQYGALAWLRSAWADEDMKHVLADAERALSEGQSASARAESEEEHAYIEEASARHELEALQQLHQGEIVQAVSRANSALQTSTREQERAARELRQADQRLQRATQVVASSQQAVAQEMQVSRSRILELRQRAITTLGALPDTILAQFATVADEPGNEQQGDTLFAQSQELDRELAHLEAQAVQLRQAHEAVLAARQIERDVHAKHNAAETSTHRTRQALWSRWERLRMRWPDAVTPIPTGDPALPGISTLAEAALKNIDLSRVATRDATTNIVQNKMHVDELAMRVKALDAELSRPAEEVHPNLSKQRERAYQQIAAVDSEATPLFWHIDFGPQAEGFTESIEALLSELDLLTSQVTKIPVATLTSVLKGQVDWRLIVPDYPGAVLPNTNRPALPGSVAHALVTTNTSIRAMIDDLLSQCRLVADTQTTGDYLCADGRYRLGGVEGHLAPIGKTGKFIGALRRRQAAADRRSELLAERETVQRELTAKQEKIAAEQSTITETEERIRRLEESSHLLEEVRLRLLDLQDLQGTLSENSQELESSQRRLQEAETIEHGFREQWKASVGIFSAITDPTKLAIVRQGLAQAVTDALQRASEARTRLGQLQQRVRAAEEALEAENEVYGITRERMGQADRDVDEAQRLLSTARGALRAAGLENVELRITELQQRLRSAQENARQKGVAKGVAMHQLEAVQQRYVAAGEQAKVSAQHLTERNDHFLEMLHVVMRSLELPPTVLEDAQRYARQLTKGRESRNRLDDDLPRVLAAAEREQESFIAAIGEYQAMVGLDEKFGLRQPQKHALKLAPQGYLMDAIPRREGTPDITILLEFLQTSIEQLKVTLADRVTRVVRDIILGEVVAHLVEQLARAQEIIEGLNERLANARFFARNTQFSMRLSVRLSRHPDIPFDHVTVATALVEHGRAMPSSVRAELTHIFSAWLDEQMSIQTQPTVETLVEQLDYRRWVDISLLHCDDLDSRVRPWDSAVSGFGSGGEQRVPVYVLLITAAAMQFAVSNAPLRLLMHDEAFARMDQRNADLVIRFAQQLGVGLVIASPNLDLFAEGVKYATAYRLRQLPNGLIAREALHLRAVEETPDPVGTGSIDA